MWHTEQAEQREQESKHIRDAVTQSTFQTFDSYDYYIQKTFLKTASLIAKSCKAATLLGGCSAEIAQKAHEFGSDFGIAFQVGTCHDDW